MISAKRLPEQMLSIGPHLHLFSVEISTTETATQFVDYQIVYHTDLMNVWMEQTEPTVFFRYNFDTHIVEQLTASSNE